jgi:deoxyadenosine/deoxycytidine kinase
MGLEKKCFFVVLDGNVGSGKTTLLKRAMEDPVLSQYCMFVEEPIEEFQKLLPAFYAGTMSAFEFQLHVCNCIYENMMDRIRDFSLSNKRIIVFERDLYSSLIFMKANVMPRTQFDILQATIRHFKNALYREMGVLFGMKPQKYRLFLNASPSLCMKRIQQRARPGEKLTMAYLDKLHATHMEMYFIDSPVVEKRHISVEIEGEAKADIVFEKFSEFIINTAQQHSLSVQ